MKIAVGNDHAGVEIKQVVIDWLSEQGYEFENLGANTLDSVDYPDYGHKIASVVETGEYDFGVLICGTGIGVSLAANKHQKIRAALCWMPEIAELARLHNDANILCMPGRFIDGDMAIAIMDKFFSTAFEGGRHQRRVDKIPLL